MNRLTSSVIHSAATENPASNWVFSPASYLEAMYRLGICVNQGNLAEVATALNTTPGALPVAATRFTDSLGALETYNTILARGSYRDFLVDMVLETLKALNTDLMVYETSLEAVATVNRIVAEKTRGKITDLLAPEHVNELTQLILLNCVYFKQDWTIKFDKPTYDEPFTNADGTTTQIGLLKRQYHYRYYEGDGYDIVEIRYQNTDICCYLMVPTTAPLFALVEQFGKHYANVAKVGYGLDCHLTAPPFKIENTWEALPKWTQAAGIRRPFMETQDWSVFDWVKTNGGWAKVDQIIQKAYIDFTYQGTEMAAATSISITGCCSGMPWGDPPPVKYIRADKPFLFCLANSKNPETPMFVGAVNKL